MSLRPVPFNFLAADNPTHRDALGMRADGVPLSPCEGVLVRIAEGGGVTVRRCTACGDVLDVEHGMVVRVESPGRDAPYEPPGTAEPAFTCPDCGLTSHNLHDVATGYCGACHKWYALSPAMVAEAVQARRKLREIGK
jgi:predicted RNA-binding Zn-ribbon protein involved in translation (DUF1610 family)